MRQFRHQHRGNALLLVVVLANCTMSRCFFTISSCVSSFTLSLCPPAYSQAFIECRPLTNQPIHLSAWAPLGRHTHRHTHTHTHMGLDSDISARSCETHTHTHTRAHVIVSSTRRVSHHELRDKTFACRRMALVHMYVHMNFHVYISIYIYNVCIHVKTYSYIYLYVYMCCHIYS